MGSQTHGMRSGLALPLLLDRRNSRAGLETTGDSGTGLSCTRYTAILTNNAPCYKYRYAPANITGAIAATGTPPHPVTLVNPICAKQFHRHYSEQPALQRDHYCSSVSGIAVPK